MSNKKPALGRGLSALLNNYEEGSTDYDQKEISAALGSIAELNLNEIETNPLQPRTQFDQEALEELALSIRELGIIQPVTVRKVGNNRYQLISGERRFRASRIAKLETIPAYIRVANDQSMLEMALVENIQRENLDAIEVAISYNRLIEECNLTQEKLSARVGKKRSTITNYMRLLKLPAEIQLAIRNKKISMGHARALVNVEEEKTQVEIYKRVINEGLSVRQVEEISQKEKSKSGKTSEGRTKSQADSMAVSLTNQKFLDDLGSFLGSKPVLQQNSKGSGKLVIPFKSNEDLERIIDLLDL